ncbi:expressed sequence [Capsaspora owczarzaki ATCC 30864]|nr:expressed sequence [Capsaspora owczarzaki ATCC 30864]|eukprot:XP_004344369.1 expressed sequence [Capsaspora owczarzaki ATCC 30864]
MSSSGASTAGNGAGASDMAAERLAVAQYATVNADALGTVQLSSLDTNVLTATAGAPREHLVDLARAIQDADVTLRATTGAKMQVIVDQIRLLQMQARVFMEEARRDADLHRAACNFTKRAGTTYHLYRRDGPQDDGVPYLSLLSPEEWGARGTPHTFVGSYRLEADQTWTPVERIRHREDNSAFVQRLLGPNIIKYTDAPLFTQQLNMIDNSYSSVAPQQLLGPSSNSSGTSESLGSAGGQQPQAVQSYQSSQSMMMMMTPQQQQQNPMAQQILNQSTLVTPVPKRQLGNAVPLPASVRQPEGFEQAQ